MITRSRVSSQAPHCLVWELDCDSLLFVLFSNAVIRSPLGLSMWTSDTVRRAAPDRSHALPVHMGHVTPLSRHVCTVLCVARESLSEALLAPLHQNLALALRTEKYCCCLQRRLLPPSTTGGTSLAPHTSASPSTCMPGAHCCYCCCCSAVLLGTCRPCTMQHPSSSILSSARPERHVTGAGQCVVWMHRACDAVHFPSSGRATAAAGFIFYVFTMHIKKVLLPLPCCCPLLQVWPRP